MKAFILLLGLSLLLNNSLEVTQTPYNTFCSQCMGVGYQYCSTTCQTQGDTCGSTASTNIYSSWGLQTKSNRVYFDITLNQGQWCMILMQNGLSASSSSDATVRWYINTNTTANVWKRSQSNRSIASFTDSTLYNLQNFGSPLSVGTTQNIAMGGSDIIILVNTRTSIKKDKPAAGTQMIKNQNKNSEKQPQLTVQQQSALDSNLQLKIQKIENFQLLENNQENGYSREELSKCYIRILLDDDNYNTGFGRIIESESGSIDIEWDEQIFVKVGNDKDVENCQIYIIVCINTESEISYLDKMISTYEMNLQDYSDQRSRMIQYDVEDENKIGNRNPSIPKDQLNLPKFSFQIRFCYSRVLFQQGLLMDLAALIDKEFEYLQYLQNCIQAINEVIVRSQAIVRGYLVRVNTKKLT
eukprot:403370798